MPNGISHLIILVDPYRIYWLLGINLHFFQIIKFILSANSEGSDHTPNYAVLISNCTVLLCPSKRTHCVYRLINISVGYIQR